MDVVDTGPNSAYNSLLQKFRLRLTAAGANAGGMKPIVPADMVLALATNLNAQSGPLVVQACLHLAMIELHEDYPEESCAKAEKWMREECAAALPE